MCINTKKEQLSTSLINLYKDSTNTLRSHIAENDKMPIWDGEILVCDKTPDNNKELLGKVMVQAKSTGVTVLRRIL